MKNWFSFPYCLEYTSSFFLLYTPSKETEDLHRVPWGCGKRLGWGLGSVGLCCKSCALLRGIYLPSGSDPSPRLCSFWQPAATSSTNNVLGYFLSISPPHPVVVACFLAQWIFLCDDIICAPARNNCPISVVNRERTQKWFSHQRFLTDVAVGGFAKIIPIFSMALHGVRLFLNDSYFLVLLQNRLQKLPRGILAKVEFCVWCFTFAPHHLVRISTCNVAACIFCEALLLVLFAAWHFFHSPFKIFVADVWRF